jgi:hypothetical protein
LMSTLHIFIVALSQASKAQNRTNPLASQNLTARQLDRKLGPYSFKAPY